ncbi:hypothetical protein DACRYDRAFT_22504 [Dacryopinax primogenitus]|uniref:RNase III domain-containing protein n=1 Tax=Dacryopinax primogenitus (strain DJM 731) TaxID=1858805 RepID=M5G668_DACPD|nr:uncharacterized protein DACRYDRAFT_22504 [Dacryopinax primogenitus]EJU01327.1 hypothetical protein DACRYDRAFT_22504 [Dacryopinax primogenitus]
MKRDGSINRWSDRGRYSEGGGILSISERVAWRTRERLPLALKEIEEEVISYLDSPPTCVFVGRMREQYGRKATLFSCAEQFRSSVKNSLPGPSTSFPHVSDDPKALSPQAKLLMDKGPTRLEDLLESPLLKTGALFPYCRLTGTHLWTMLLQKYARALEGAKADHEKEAKSGDTHSSDSHSLPSPSSPAVPSEYADPQQSGLLAGLDQVNEILEYPSLPEVTDRLLLKQVFVSVKYAERNVVSHDKRNNNGVLAQVGDSVITMALRSMLWRKYPHLQPHGVVSVLRLLESNKALDIIGKAYNLDKSLSRRPRRREWAVADAFEAYVGAMYESRGFQVAVDFLQRLYAPMMTRAYHLVTTSRDPSTLQYEMLYPVANTDANVLLANSSPEPISPQEAGQPDIPNKLTSCTTPGLSDVSADENTTSTRYGNGFDHFISLSLPTQIPYIDTTPEPDVATPEPVSVPQRSEACLADVEQRALHKSGESPLIESSSSKRWSQETPKPRQLSYHEQLVVLIQQRDRDRDLVTDPDFLVKPVKAESKISRRRRRVKKAKAKSRSAPEFVGHLDRLLVSDLSGELVLDLGQNGEKSDGSTLTAPVSPQPSTSDKQRMKKSNTLGGRLAQMELSPPGSTPSQAITRRPQSKRLPVAESAFARELTRAIREVDEEKRLSKSTPNSPVLGGRLPISPTSSINVNKDLLKIDHALPSLKDRAQRSGHIRKSQGNKLASKSVAVEGFELPAPVPSSLPSKKVASKRTRKRRARAVLSLPQAKTKPPLTSSGATAEMSSVAPVSTRPEITGSFSTTDMKAGTESRPESRLRTLLELLDPAPVSEPSKTLASIAGPGTTSTIFTQPNNSFEAVELRSPPAPVPLFDGLSSRLFEFLGMFGSQQEQKPRELEEPEKAGRPKMGEVEPSAQVGDTFSSGTKTLPITETLSDPRDLLFSFNPGGAHKDMLSSKFLARNGEPEKTFKHPPSRQNNIGERFKVMDRPPVHQTVLPRYPRMASFAGGLRSGGLQRHEYRPNKTSVRVTKKMFAVILKKRK